MKIFIAADHAGFARKEKLKDFLAKSGYEIEDLGANELNQDDDYPDYGLKLGEKVVDSQVLGILVCGNGQGVCIAANKVQGIRAVSAFTIEMAKTTRLDDDANVLCLPGRFLSDQEVEEIVATWLETEFSKADRHQRRIEKITNYER